MANTYHSGESERLLKRSNGGVDTPAVAYWMSRVNVEPSLEQHLRDTELLGGSEALETLGKYARELVQALDERQLAEGEI